MRQLFAVEAASCGAPLAGQAQRTGTIRIPHVARVNRSPDSLVAAGRQRKPPIPQMEWAWFFDFDGTLVEIASSPARIVVHDDLAPTIVQLHWLTGGAVAVITGRAISDVDRFLPLPGVSVVGQHGLEQRHSNGETMSPPVRDESLRRLSDALTDAVARHPGLVAEFKGMSIALHYRMAPRLAGYAHRLLRSLQVEYAPEFVIQKGKRVVELKSAAADKGQVIRRLMIKEPFKGRVPVFIGDDLTDEVGFRVVNEMSGYSIKVGPGPTCARFRLRTVAQVREWLSAGMGAVAAGAPARSERG